MKVAIVYNHPYSGSFCNAILHSVLAGIAKSGHEADVFNLDEEGFNPVMTAADLKAFVMQKPVDLQVLAYHERLKEADHLVFIFPIWWELMPALTKGFIDKVIFPGLAYAHPKNSLKMTPLLTNLKRVTVISTMNTPSWLYRILFGNAIRKAMMVGTFWKIGFKNRKWISLTQVKSATHAKRRKWLDRIEERFTKLK
ncbi:NAD(P)H-dependent oxidoreductase [Pedobacter nyackensis]|uniref:Putative NADPH-quinone reductase (Modulator of drug activity B) n=1 Tax=Pedobacter nyackensis TaxID=475255 RepID=A0A1W2EZE2_9SPHI|nr:NAD(P)H-dependent oxidoreductase [Pedobacter nyackensis]SMD14598.1 Putative NADPH-quinone reductase (modulator of drug activity B) [Pedobacter nyackensis]